MQFTPRLPSSNPALVLRERELLAQHRDGTAGPDWAVELTELRKQMRRERRAAATVQLPAGLRWVAANASTIGDCRDGHLALDDGLSGTLCGRVHGGDTDFGPQRLGDACGNCVRIARKHGLVA